MQDLRQMVLDQPEKPSYVMGGSGEVITRMQLEERANQCAHFFRESGLQTGGHIAILMENNRVFLEICSAANRAGLLYTAISTFLTLSEIEYVINNCGARIFITSSAYCDTAEKLQHLIPDIEVKLMLGDTIPGYESYQEKISQFPTTPIADPMAGRDMLYSSGTTGRPKGIKINHDPLAYGEVLDSSKSIIKLYGIDENTVYLSPAPLYHAAPLRFCMMVLYCGGSVILMEKFNPQQALALIEKYSVTHSQWVPTMFVRMQKLEPEIRTQYDLSSMKIAIHAAAPIPIPLKEEMIQWWGPILFEYYAGTEGNGFNAITSEEWLGHKGSVGRSIIGQVHILDDGGKELPQGETGTIYYSDGQVFEYHDDPEKTAASRSAEGWSTLNDIGHLDEEGYLYLTDRKTNMIISGGVNIYPQETENILIMHPKVLDAAVIGVPDADFGEKVKGVVQLKDPADAGADMERELMEFCLSQLSKIKCPASIDFSEELPRTPTGKLLKRRLKDKYWNAGQNI